MARRLFANVSDGPEVLSFLAGLEPCLIGMEACATSHYWARELAKFGHTGTPHARRPMIGKEGDRRVRAAMVLAVTADGHPRLACLSSRETAKALIFTPVWETSEGIPVPITRRQFLTKPGNLVPGSALVSARAMSIGSQKAADSEAMAKGAAEKATAAKDRLDRLAKCEDVAGELGKRENFEKVVMDAGWTRDDIRHAIELNRLCDGRDDLFDAILNEGCKLHHRREKSDRWKVLRKVRAMRGR
jgi:hypothetical protein